MQAQGRAIDQSGSQQSARAGGADLKRILNLGSRQLADIAGDKARAEIAVGL
jgi:hypothetical protein